MPRLALEDLPPVPVQMGGLRLPVGVLGVADRLAMKGQSLLEARGPIRSVGHEQYALGDGEDAEIERLVVQHAQRQDVALSLRASRLVPADMGGVQGDRDRVETLVEAAHRATVFVSLEHALPKS